MLDKEKVIKGLEICTSRPCYCTDCPYKKECYLDSQNVMEDALTLLKEQDKIIQNILLEKANELNDKVTALQIEEQNREIRRIFEANEID